jgi:hypothetical protein
MTLVFVLACLTPADAAFAASSNAGKNTYVSQADKLLTVHKLGVLPVTDNVNGLYSRYVENKLTGLIKSGHRFSLVEIKDADARPTLDDYESNQELIKRLGTKYGVDGLLGARVSKQSGGVDMTVDLFLTADGKLIAQEQITGDPRFEVTDLENKTADLYGKVINKLPYKGLVLSRQGNRVTIDVGAKDGIREGTIVTVEQIIAIKRHPKFHFLLSSEREIMGKIKIAKVDETLSFGVVLQEKDKGVIGLDSKVTGLDFVTYAEPAANGVLPPAGPEPLNDPVSFGKNPREWKPPEQPGYGKIGFTLGLGSFRDSITLLDVPSNTQSSYSDNVTVYPQLKLSSEIWLTPHWYLGAGIQQGVLSVTNPQSGSSPTKLGANTAHYNLQLGYKFLLQQEDFWGPQINFHMGFAKYSLSVDASTPLTFTSMSYSGLVGGIGGSIPINVERTYYLNVNLDRYLFPSLSETPASSGGTSDNSVTFFSFGGSRKLTPQFWIVAQLDFEFYFTTFGGTGTRQNGTGGAVMGLNSSQTLITLNGGIEYLF